MRNRKKQSLKFIIVLVLICFGIGYAYLTTNLSINGITDIDANNWNIYWNNVQITTGSVTGDQVTQAPTIDTNKTTVSFHVRLSKPGDFFEFTVDAVNSGTIDAMIETITKTSNIPEYMKYEVYYSNDVPIAKKQLISANSTVTYKVRFEFKKNIDAEDLPSSSDSLDLVFGIEYVQADDSSVALPNLSFGLTCSEDRFFFYDGMTVKDWLQSDIYPGNIGGKYETLEDCKSVWGNNKGCSKRNYVRYVYREIYSYYTYTDSLDECNEGLNCTTVNNLYKGVFTYEEDVYNTYEECKTESELNDCELINGKYAAYLLKRYYTSQNECNDELSWADYYSCNLLPTAYKYNGYYDHEYYTSEDCLEDNPGGNCTATTFDYYGPEEKEGNSGFNITEYSLLYVGNPRDYDYLKYFSFDSTLESTTYSCFHGAECVSPESDILSGNGKTIKAKDIKENDLIVYYNFDTNRTEIGRVSKVFIHKDANNLIRYEFEDNTYLEATDYHPIYTKEGWKSYTNRNGYPKPVIGDLVKTNKGYKRITKIVPYIGKEDYYDFQIISKDGKVINNYYANGTLVQGSY